MASTDWRIFLLFFVPTRSTQGRGSTMAAKGLGLEQRKRALATCTHHHSRIFCTDGSPSPHTLHTHCTHTRRGSALRRDTMGLETHRERNGRERDGPTRRREMAWLPTQPGFTRRIHTHTHTSHQRQDGRGLGDNQRHLNPRFRSPQRSQAPPTTTLINTATLDK